jgi:prevent-host-death family protein
MKEKPSDKYKESPPSALELKEVATMPDVGLVIPLRAAKAKLSALLDLVASGRQVTITSAGVPKVVLSPATPDAGRVRFTGMGDFLLSQPMHRVALAEEVVSEDRDSRGW